MKQITAKLLAFQRKVGTIKKDSKNPHFKNTYASLTQILSEVKPILSECELVLTQPINEKGVGTVISFNDEVLESFIPLPVGVNPQQLGSAITYFRRFTLASLLALEIDDDDAETATKVNLDNKTFTAMIEAANNGKVQQVKDAMSKYQMTEQQKTALNLAIKNNE